MASRQIPGIVTLLVLFFPISQCFTADVVFEALYLGGLDAAVTCCSLPFCSIEQPCPLGAQDSHARNIHDGNASTEWIVPSLVSNDSYQIAFSFPSFGQYMLHSVTLLSTTQYLPQKWIFSTSEVVRESTNSGVFEQHVDFENEQIYLQAFNLTVDLPSATFPEAISIAEIILVVSGSGLAGDEGCVECVDQLRTTLDMLIIDLQNSSSSLDSLVNQTELRLLRQEVEEAKFGVGQYEDSLLVLSVVLGSNPPLNDSITLSDGVRRVDTELVPPIPNKLEQLAGRVDSTTSFELNLDDLQVLLYQVEQQLTDTTFDYAGLVADVETIRANSTQLIATLTIELSAIMEVLVNVQDALEFVSSTNFDSAETDLMTYQTATEPLVNTSSELYDTIILTNQQAMGVEFILDDIDPYLQEALAIIDRLNDESLDTLMRVAVIDDLLAQIEALRSEVELLNSSFVGAIENTANNLDQALDLLQNLNTSVQLVSDLLQDLRPQIDLLRDEVEEFVLLILPFRLPPSCDLSLPCSADEVHADMLYSNASEIVNSSFTISTLRRARAFLDIIISQGRLFDYSAVNQTALRALDIARNAQRVFVTIDTRLMDQVEKLLEMIQLLVNPTLAVFSRASRIASREQSLRDSCSDLEITVEMLQDDTDTLRNETSRLRNSIVLDSMLLLQAQEARNRTVEAEERTSDIEDGLEIVASSIVQTQDNIEEASDELSRAENKFPSISLFLNATREKIGNFVLNTSAFISENDRIIGEIRSIVSGLEDIYNRINQINSPVQLVSSNGELPYLSLQPPPGFNMMSDAIQFESMDLYLWTGSQFTTPSLLFYAGPIYYEINDPITAMTSSAVDEDYFILTVEGDQQLQLQWSLGGSVGTVSTAFAQGFSQIVVTRHGSQFQLRYGVMLGGLDSGDVAGDVLNGSLAFRMSNRTAFLVGGWPAGAQLGVPSSIIPLNQYSHFQGQVQLLLFNGQQWGLWSIRGEANTNLIGSFQRSMLASINVWPGLIRSSAISFDGSGYLFVKQLSNVQGLGSQRTISVMTLPVNEQEGLVFYAYDETLMVSMELAYRDETFVLVIRRHDTNATLVDHVVNRGSGESIRDINVLFVEGTGFLIDQDTFLSDSHIFFNNPSNVKVWFGGVSQGHLKSPYIPQVTTASYQGCLSINLQDGQLPITLLRGGHFVSTYLESPIQRGFSGTCLQNVYAREVGFDGSEESFLLYMYINFDLPANNPSGQVGGATVNGATVVSFSFLTQRNDGVLLLVFAEDTTVSCTVVLSDLNVLVQINQGSNVVSLNSSERVEIGSLQQFFLELSDKGFDLYINGLLQDSKPALSGFSFELITSSSSTEPVLYVGGGSASLPDISVNVPPFTGCMRDLAFNFNAMGFLNPALSDDRRYPSGVTYHSCPFLNVTRDPFLAVRPNMPQNRVCLARAPSVLPDTHGGFHRGTRLTTSNIIGLLSSSWTFSFSLRLVDDGHVMTLESIDGHEIRLLIRNRQVVMVMKDVLGGTMETVGGQLNQGVFIDIDISCAVDDNLATLSCFLSVGSVPSMDEPLVVPYFTGSIFFPNLPLVFGKVTDEDGNLMSDSFVGCIRDLAINGRLDGFSGVHSGVECYNATQPGLGFSGISRISALVSGVSQEISLVFQPQLDNGLLLMLSYANASSPAIAVGLFNGELRISDLSEPGIQIYDALGRVCDSFQYNFTLTYNGTYLEAAVQSVGGGTLVNSIQLPFSPRVNQLLVTIGNIPSQLVLPGDSTIFGFLLSEFPSSNLPPGLVGCVIAATVDGSDLLTLDDVTTEHVLDEFCPSA